MEGEFTAEVWHWRGPAPHHFVWVPDELSEAIHDIARDVTYGWGMIPVTIRVGRTSKDTALWPKDGRYIVPLRADLRRDEGVEIGDRITVGLTVRFPTRGPADR